MVAARISSVYSTRFVASRYHRERYPRGPLTALNRARQQADRRCAPTSAIWHEPLARPLPPPLESFGAPGRSGTLAVQELFIDRLHPFNSGSKRELPADSLASIRGVDFNQIPMANHASQLPGQ